MSDWINGKIEDKQKKVYAVVFEKDDYYGEEYKLYSSLKTAKTQYNMYKAGGKKVKIMCTNTEWENIDVM